MPHQHLALAHARLLRCRRCIYSALTQAVVAMQPKGYVDTTDEVWHQFERGEMKESLMRMTPIICAQTVYGMCIGILSICTGDSMLSLTSGSVPLILFLFHSYVEKLMCSGRLTPMMEWRLCILHQCAYAILSFGWAISSVKINDALFAHRTFCLKYMWATAITSCFNYLPIQFHMIVVSGVSIITWMLFHWAMDFVRVVPILAGFLLPIGGLAVMKSTREKSWRIFSIVEKERHARILSESLMQTLRGVLNVTFDASFECDEQGIILKASPQLLQLLGHDCCDLSESSLKELAASANEAQRLDTFLHQVTSQNQSHIACPPALLETVLRSSGSQAELKVSLCLVALPTGCTVHDAAPLRSCRRFFVGVNTKFHSWDREGAPISPWSSDDELGSISPRSSGHHDKAIWNPEKNGTQVGPIQDLIDAWPLAPTAISDDPLACHQAVDLNEGIDNPHSSIDGRSSFTAQVKEDSHLRPGASVNNGANAAGSEGQPNLLHLPLSSSLLNRMNAVQRGGHIRFETLSETSGCTGSMSDSERTTPSEELARTLPTGLREVPPPITSQRRPTAISDGALACHQAVDVNEGIDNPHSSIDGRRKEGASVSNEANAAGSEGQPNQLHVPLSSSLLNRMNTVQHGRHIRFESLSETSGSTASMSDAERTTPSEELARTLPTGLREVPPPITSQRRPNPG